MKNSFTLAVILLPTLTISLLLAACGVNEPTEPKVEITGCTTITVDGHAMGGSLPYGLVSFNQSGSDSKGTYNYHVELSWNSSGCLSTVKATKL